MAFTESQKLSICKIVGIDIINLQERLNYYVAYITAEVETQVAAELARWDTAGTQFVRLRAKESNKGVETSSDDAKNDIRKNIATLLFLADYINAVSAAQGVLVR